MGYTSTTTPFSATQLQEALDRAEAELLKRTSTVFVDGTDTTPVWIKVTHETHTGKGYADKTYFLNKYPLPDVSTTVNGTAVGTADTSVFVVDTQGFPSSGFITIESDKITYTGKSGSAFTGASCITSVHGTAETVSPITIEISTSTEGQTPSWSVMEHDVDCHVDLNTGRTVLYDSSLDVSNNVTYSRFPEYQTANRFRASYITGVDNIPADIIRAELMIAAKDLMHSVVRKAHGSGMNDFNPDLVDLDQKWIDDTINRYKKLKSQLI